MPSSAISFARGLVLGCVAVSLLLAGCSARHVSSADAIATFTLTTRAGITDYAIDPDPLKRAAAGYFRDVAINAPGEPGLRLDRRVRDALYSEKGVHRSLDAKIRARIEPQLEALAAAAGRGDRQRIALTSLEAYRLLTEDLSTEGKVTLAMTLIDYAQLVGAAQLRSKQPDWPAIDAALLLAGQQWREVSHGLDDPRQGDEMAKSLFELDQAAQQRDPTAMQAALAASRPRYGRLAAYVSHAGTAWPAQIAASSPS